MIDSKDLFQIPVEVRTLRVGEKFGRWDIWNTCRGLERIPFRKIGETIRFKNPRDIFLKPLTMTHGMNQDEWEDWNRRDRNMYE